MTRSPPAPSSAENFAILRQPLPGCPGGGCFCTRPGAGDCGHCRRNRGFPAGDAPVRTPGVRRRPRLCTPTFLLRRQKKSRRARWKRKTLGVTFAAQRSNRGSPQSAGWKISASAGCAIHCTSPILLRRKSRRGSFRWCRAERSVRLLPGVPLCYALPWVVIVCCPGMRVTRGSRRTGLSIFCHGKHPMLTFAATGFRRMSVYNAPGRRLPDSVGSV